MRIFALIFTLVFAALLFATPSHAQKIELYGGYSLPISRYVPANCGAMPRPRLPHGREYSTSQPQRLGSFCCSKRSGPTRSRRRVQRHFRLVPGL